MSRLIVKNLPNGMKEERFRQLFTAFGTLTDCSLKFTKDGKFRKFGFIGFKSEEEAQTALNHFNRSFIDTSRITVEFCKSFGDPTKPRAWSKHAQKPSQSKPPPKDRASVPPETKKDDGKEKVAGDLEKLKEDDKFREFLSVHQKRTQVAIWANDALDAEPSKGKSKPANDYLNFDSDSGQESEGEGAVEDLGEEGDGPEPKAAAQKELSDMDYLKSKVVQAGSSSSSEEEESEDEAMNCEEGSEAEEEGSCATPAQRDRERTGAVPGNAKPEVARAKTEKPANQKEPTTPHTVKLRGAPFNVTEKNVIEFLAPLKPVAIRIVKNAHGNKTGYVFVDFSSEEEVKKALKCNREYLGGRYIEVFREKNIPPAKAPLKNTAKPWQGRMLGELEDEEDLADSGRLFVRNLPYTSTEEDLEKLFSKYGPLSELHCPIDSLTKKPKGFAFVAFMFPEHAVKAYAEVDGQVFQGRMLHVLPSTIKKESSEDTDTPGSSSYKKKKESKDKANSSSSHNWNTLFMGPNAVADAIAQKYSASKSQVFDHETKGSVAVRVALGETQLVQEVRRFLIDNGVSLDSFSQAAAERSKTVILVKNLPAGTLAAELQETFGRFGSLGRVLLPEGGVTAIVEFLEPLEARRAFRHLAYSKFHHIPLYLEWAPVGVFSSPAPQKKEPQDTLAEPDKQDTTEPETDCKTPEGEKPKEGEADNVSAKMEEEEEEEDEEEESLPGCTLFIKNLNFSTTEETLKAVFSKVGLVKSCSISKKKNKAGALLSMGFGFVEYRKPEQAQKALRQLQGHDVDGHKLEVRISERATKPAPTSARKKQIPRKQTTSKILVRNIPFQADSREIRELFSTFGELKTVRLPKKMTGTGTHRGFGFVDFLTKQDAKRAFNALCHSTHLYGRRLVLEWADSEVTLQALRRKTAEHFHEPPKKKRSVVLDEILEQLEDSENDGEEQTLQL
ncbi:probable RNA-binding protein 19 [Camelus ferus]|uniref:Probable RNA-binding protein 19 n=1 Tax=Camelus ferus TaxID=419612 RepID=A0A8B7K9X0_CAMFR|nr:probable RNA-binding protein 19 [Camelus ferus]XP_014413977.2 probable RNA-binding protein 19 [Camelus ferus]XP_014417783.2 probable RNA-binding protein 19 [Camelus ferus]XP_014417784.2 probable RNA-binding protein 19 [Camelus ferus]XP_032327877.1 probable RNA-binding protein 19 [Camelus ferus]